MSNQQEKRSTVPKEPYLRSTVPKKVMEDLGLIPNYEAVKHTEDKDLQMYKEHLSLLVARGKTKDYIGKILTYSDLDNMSPKDLEKYY